MKETCVNTKDDQAKKRKKPTIIDIENQLDSEADMFRLLDMMALEKRMKSRY